MRTHARWTCPPGVLPALVLVIALGLPGVALTQTRAAAAAPGEPDLAQLKQRVEQRFQVLTLRQSLVLVPREKRASAANVELSDGLVLVDGSPVTGKELRDRLGADAAIVVQLSFLDGDTRRQLFAPAAETRPALPDVEPPAPPAPPAVTDHGWTERERYKYGGARVRIGGDVAVKEDEAVADDVVAVLGSVRIDGRVNGEVVAVGGSVYLGPKADVRGGVTSVGGGIERSPGARVDGEINEVMIGAPRWTPFVRIRPWQDWTWFASPFGASVKLVGTLVRMAIVGLFAALLIALVPGPVRRIADRVAVEPWRAGLVGLAAQILFVPLLVLTVVILAVSIIGIPLLLLVPFALLAVLVALLMGLTGAGCAIGQLIGRRTSGGVQSLLVSLVVGLTVVWALTVIARFVGVAGLPIHLAIGGVAIAGFLIEYLAWTVGLGAVLLSRFGRRSQPFAAVAVPPPPLPDPSGPNPFGSSF